MSLAIQIEKVTEVLLADGWHSVSSGSFDLDAYEYLDDAVLIHGGGANGVCATGFSFREIDEPGRVVGPLTSILAVRYG